MHVSCSSLSTPVLRTFAATHMSRKCKSTRASKARESIPNNPTGKLDPKGSKNITTATRASLEIMVSQNILDWFEECTSAIVTAIQSRNKHGIRAEDMAEAQQRMHDLATSSDKTGAAKNP